MENTALKKEENNFINRIKKPIIAEDVEFKGEKNWIYELRNIKNGKWYIGAGMGPIEEYDTSSENEELLNAISNNEMEKYILEFDNSYITIKIRETQILKGRNAKNDSMSYNQHNGMEKIDKIPDLEKMWDIAAEILEFGQFANISSKIYNLIGEKEYINGKGKLKSTSRLNNVVALQIRPEEFDKNHLYKLKERIDDLKGNLDLFKKDTNLELVVIHLEKRKYKGKECTLRIGGNHTLMAIITSKYGYKVKILTLPPSVHKEWSDDEIRLLGEYLNPLHKNISLETSEDGAIKTCFILAQRYGNNTGLINDHLNKLGFGVNTKIRIKKTVTRKLNTQEEENGKPENFITYTTDDKILNDKVKNLKKPDCIVKKMSTGKILLGEIIAQIFGCKYKKRKIFDKDLNIVIDYGKIKEIKIVLYHPNWVKFNHFKKRYEKDFKTFQRLVKSEGVKLTWIEMPHLKAE